MITALPKQWTIRGWRARLVAIALMPGLLLVCGCGAAVRGISRGVVTVHNSELFYQGRHGALTRQEQEWAQVAWKYFQTNTNPGTGLVNGVQGQHRTTMWETGDYLSALLAARRMKLIDEREFQDRFTRLLLTLNTMQLAGDLVPNRYYSTENAHVLSWEGKEEPDGWSAMDLGRLMLWLRIARTQKPEFAEYIDKIIMRWNFCRVIDDSGTLFQGSYDKGILHVEQEGRLGYEEYAALGFQAWGFTTDKASRIQPYQKIKLYDLQLFYDGRDERQTGTLAPIVSTPYLLSGMELNWGSIAPRPAPAPFLEDPQGQDEPSTAELARSIYRSQETRYEKDKIFTARTDHHISHAPFQVVDSIFVKGYAWNTVSESGERMPNESLVATQAVFPMRALWKTPYTDRLTRVIERLYDPDKGWYEGRFESTGGIERTISLRTNAMVLESLFYQLDGKLFRGEGAPGLYAVWKKNPYAPKATCSTARASQ